MILINFLGLFAIAIAAGLFWDWRRKRRQAGPSRPGGAR